MDSTSHSPSKGKSSDEIKLAKVIYSRGISAKACTAKAMTWELKSAKVLPKYEASISEVSLP